METIKRKLQDENLPEPEHSIFKRLREYISVSLKSHADRNTTAVEKSAFSILG